MLLNPGQATFDSIYIDNISLEYIHPDSLSEVDPGGNDGVEENNLIVSNVYPNPFNDVVNFKFNNLESASTLTIIDLTGKTVFSKEIKSNEFSWKPATELNKGMYFYTVKNADKVEYGKIIYTKK